MSNQLGPYRGRRNLPARTQRAVLEQVDAIQGDALVSAVRTQGIRYVGQAALRTVEDLTDMETLALARNPQGAARYRAIVDVATARLAQIVAETGQGW